MTEFELQQLLIATRWEFDIPTLLIGMTATAFMAIGLARFKGVNSLSIRLMQLAFAAIWAFWTIRAAAAIVRLGKLSYLLMEQDPQFEYWNPSLQWPTLLSRIALHLILLVITLYVLNKSKPQQND